MTTLSPSIAYIRRAPLLAAWLCNVAALLLFASMAMNVKGADADIVSMPRPTSNVVDLTGALGVDEDRLAQRIARLRENTGVQLTVLVLRDTGAEPIDVFAQRVFERWRPGERDNDGLLLVIATANDSRRVRLQVGRSLEGAIPDVVAARFLQEQVRPALDRDGPGAAVTVALDAIEPLLEVKAKLTDEGLRLDPEDAIRLCALAMYPLPLIGLLAGMQLRIRVKKEGWRRRAIADRACAACGTAMAATFAGNWFPTFGTLIGLGWLGILAWLQLAFRGKVLFVVSDVEPFTEADSIRERPRFLKSSAIVVAIMTAVTALPIARTINPLIVAGAALLSIATQIWMCFLMVKLFTPKPGEQQRTEDYYDSSVDDSGSDSDSGGDGGGSGDSGGGGSDA